jgi:2-dehydropantoate 2-reductase
MTERAPRIAVVGTGANGAGIGVDLVRAGHDVTFVEQWPENVLAMREHGVVVRMPGEETNTAVRAYHLCEVATFRQPFDVVFLAVKAYDTRWACELIEPLVAPDGLVVGLQNGLTHDTIADVVGVRRTLGAVIEVSAAMFEPGVVERHTPPAGSWFGIGSLDVSAAGREGAIIELLSNAGHTERSDDVRSAKWMKLVANCAEVVTSALLDLPLIEAAKLPGMHDFMVETGKEAVRVAVARGSAIVPIFGYSDVDPDAPEAFAERLLATIYEKFALPHTLTAVLQDWRKGRRSEVDDMNGVIAREQRRLGGTAPYNAWVTELAHRVERGELRHHPGNLPLLLSRGVPGPTIESEL